MAKFGKGKNHICVCGHRRREHDKNAGKCNVCDCTTFRRPIKQGK